MRRCQLVVHLGGPTATCSVSYTSTGRESVTATYAGDAATSASSGSVAVDVAQGTQTISFTAPAHGTAGHTTTLSASGGASPNAVVFSLDPSSGAGVCTLSGETLRYTRAGNCVIDANQAANDDYSAAPQVTQTIVVRSATTTTAVTASPAVAPVGQTVSYTARVNDGSGPAPTGTVTFTEGPATVCANVALSATAPYKAVCSASYTSTGRESVTATYNGDAATLASSGSAVVDVVQGSQTIRFTAPTTFTYGASFSPSATTSSSLAVSFSIDASSTAGSCSLAHTSGLVRFTGTGTCVVDADQAGTANYLSAPTVSHAITVTAAPLTVTASSATVRYGAAAPAVTPIYTGFVGGDSASSLTTAPACSSTATRSSPVGTRPTSCSGAVDANYAISYADGSVSISPAPLVVTASDAAMTGGGAAPVITPRYTGFVDGDSASSLSTAPMCSTTATSSSPTGTYPSSCSGAADANYDISYIAGTVTVNPAIASTPAATAATTGTTTATPARPPLARPPLARPPLARPPLARPPLARPPLARPPLAQPRKGGRRPLGRPIHLSPPPRTSPSSSACHRRLGLRPAELPWSSEASGSTTWRGSASGCAPPRLRSSPPRRSSQACRLAPGRWLSR